jgi:M6 family metalloprotease-like protein
MKNIFLTLITAALAQIGSAHEIPALDPKGDVYKTSGPNDDSIYGTTSGNKTMLMVYTRFPEVDEPGETTANVAERMLGDGRFLDIFQKQSYGKLKLDIQHVHGWRVMPRPRKENDPKTTEGHRQMFVDIFALYPEIDFNDYDYIVAKLPGAGNFAFGERDDRAIPYRGGFVNHAVNIGSNHPGVLAHEVAHCMGLPDVYTYGGLEPKNPAGAWDLMTSAGRAAGFIGWHRHKLDWLGTDRKTYLKEGTHTLDLTPLDSEKGVSMIVVPVSDPEKPSVVFVVEIGQPPLPAEDGLDWPAGVLVYRVDATKPSGRNPIVVFPKENLEAGATYLPGDTFQSEEAPLTLRVEKKLDDGGYRVTVGVRPATKPPLLK